MKIVSDKLNALLLEYMSGTRSTIYMADLFVFTFNSGLVLRYTSHDSDLIVGGHTYTSWAIDRGDISEERGVTVTDMTMTVYFNPSDIITAGTTWYSALQSGAFDNCYVSLDRLYSPDKWQYLMPAFSSEYVLQGRFVGRIDVNDLRLTSCELQAKSALELLNTKLPRNLLIPSCINSLYDAMCGIDRTTYAVTGTALTGSTKSSIVTALTKANGYFDQGMILCTSGLNVGVKRTIKTYASGTAKVFLPFLFAVSGGDTFTLYPGCCKTIDNCQNKFNNLKYFRGSPFIPTPESIV